MIPRIEPLSACMQKLEGLGWAAGFSITAHGAHLGVRVTDASLLPALRDRLPLGWRDSDREVVDHLVSVVVGDGDRPARVRRCHLLYADHVRTLRTLSTPELLSGFESYLEQAVIERTVERVFVHAGVVGWGDAAILIPGVSHSGKTRLVAELVRAGASYYSDEYAVLDLEALVHPYPRPLYMRREGAPPVELRVETLGGRTGRHPLPVRLVVLATFRAGAAWRPTVLRRGEAVLALLEHTPAARARPLNAFIAFEAVVRRAVILKGERGEAPNVASSILRRVDESGCAVNA